MAEPKNVYSSHDDSGIIGQSVKVFDDENGAYGKILHSREMKFVNHAGRSFADPNHHFVNNGKIANRPVMPINVINARVRAVKDHVKIKGVPKAVRITISASIGGIQHTFFDTQIDGPSLEFPVPAPGLYTVAINKHPYREWSQQIEVTE